MTAFASSYTGKRLVYGFSHVLFLLVCVSVAVIYGWVGGGWAKLESETARPNEVYN
jgi:hypothetical protein